MGLALARTKGRCAIGRVHTWTRKHGLEVYTGVLILAAQYLLAYVLARVEGFSCTYSPSDDRARSSVLAPRGRRPCRRLRTMAALLLTLFPASLLPSSQPPASAYRTLSRRAALLPLLTAPAAVSAFPNPFANPEEEKRKAEKEAAEKQRLADKQAEFMRVRKERMAAEVRLQVG